MPIPAIFSVAVLPADVNIIGYFAKKVNHSKQSVSVVFLLFT